MSPPHTLLLALMAGFGATLLAVLSGWAYFVFIGETAMTGALDNDAALAATAVTLVAAPVLVWILLSLLGLPHPLMTTLLSVPFFLVYAAIAFSGGPITQDPVWGRALGMAGMVLAVVLPALLTSRHHRLRAARREGRQDGQSDGPRAGSVPNTP